MYPLLLKKSLLSAIVIQFARSQLYHGPEVANWSENQRSVDFSRAIGFSCSQSLSKTPSLHANQCPGRQLGAEHPVCCPPEDTIDDVKAKAASDNCIAKDLLGRSCSRASR